MADGLGSGKGETLRVGQAGAGGDPYTGCPQDRWGIKGPMEKANGDLSQMPDIRSLAQSLPAVRGKSTRMRVLHAVQGVDEGAMLGEEASSGVGVGVGVAFDTSCHSFALSTKTVCSHGLAMMSSYLPLPARVVTWNIGR